MKLNRTKLRALARKLKAKAGVITNEDEMTTSPDQERRSQVLPAGSAWASKEYADKIDDGNTKILYTVSPKENLVLISSWHRYGDEKGKGKELLKKLISQYPGYVFKANLLNLDPNLLKNYMDLGFTIKGRIAEKATDVDQTSLLQPTVFETRQGVPIPINRGSGLEEPYMTPQHRFCNTDPSTSSKETSDVGGGMVNYGYENTPDLGRHPYPYNPGQTETKDALPILLRKGKWSRTYDYHPENIVTHDDLSLERIKKEEEKSAEQEIIPEKVVPQTPRMVANSSDAESGNPTVSNCMVQTIKGIPHLIDKETGEDYGSIFDFEKSPKSFAYQKNRPGQQIDHGIDDKVR